jgi:hypothetical protein
MMMCMCATGVPTNSPAPINVRGDVTQRTATYGTGSSDWPQKSHLAFFMSEIYILQMMSTEHSLSMIDNRSALQASSPSKQNGSAD